jgi:hypothetical protein
MLLCLSFLLLAVLVMKAQVPKKAPAKSVANTALNEDFADAGLRTLEGIKVEAGLTLERKLEC